MRNCVHLSMIGNLIHLEHRFLPAFGWFLLPPHIVVTLKTLPLNSSFVEQPALESDSQGNLSRNGVR
jgi:hypothetical protein